MPRVKIDYIVSFSSEDTDNQANNLLAWEVNKKKWLCSKGEPSCSVVLQLTKAVKINAVHVGVYHAALVEVLVGLSEKPNDPYQVLVPSCIFLSPMDSRRGEGMERVRSFSEEQLVAETREKKWDRVRVVCSQPYNKHCKYGLSFVHIYEPESKEQETKPVQSATAVPDRLLNFNVDTFSSDEDEFKPGELFKKHLQSNTGSGNTETQIRQATSQALKNIDDSSSKLMKTPISKTKRNLSDGESVKRTDKGTDRQRNSLMYTDDDDKPHSKIDHIVNKHKDEKAKRDEEKRKQEEKLAKQKEEKKEELRKEKERKDKRNETQKNDDRSPHIKRGKDDSVGRKKDDTPRNKDRTPQTKKTSDDGASASQSLDKPKDRKTPHSKDKQKTNRLRPGPVSDTPHTLLSGVVFVLSGYENPRRANVRDAAVAMGARFEREWSRHCTHLICAFPNTPKLKTVRASPNGQSAIVVTAEWIDQCCERRRLLPWQWFATEPALRVPHTSDDEKDDGASEEESNKTPRAKKRQRSASPSPPKKRTIVYSDEEFDDEQDKRKTSQRSPSPEVAAGGDGKHSPIDDGNRTDVDDFDQQQVEIDETRVLPDFFEGYTFSMDPTLGETFDCQLLSRYVRAYGGLLLESSQLDDEASVDYWLCSEKNSSCERVAKTCVRADWVWRCHKDSGLADTAPYVI